MTRWLAIGAYRTLVLARRARNGRPLAPNTIARYFLVLSARQPHLDKYSHQNATARPPNWHPRVRVDFDVKIHAGQDAAGGTALIVDLFRLVRPRVWALPGVFAIALGLIAGPTFA